MNEIAVRLARTEDACALHALNEAFNGDGLSAVSRIAETLANNDMELVGFAEVDAQPAGFCCAQVKRSFCCAENSAELTELYVAEEFRRMGVAARLVGFIEDICRNERGVTEFTLLTGAENRAARRFYESIGYKIEDEVLYAKR